MKHWSIYKLVCPITDIVRYIGITTQILEQRLKYHLTGNNHNSGMEQWIIELQMQSLLPLIIPIDNIIGTRTQAEDRERYWIYEYIKAGHDLLNKKHVLGDRETFFEFLRSPSPDL